LPHKLTIVISALKTWFFPLCKEHKLRIFENRVLRRIFGPMREA
jgi:hypothetical protein